jgi:acyl-CoA thioesterase I
MLPDLAARRTTNHRAAMDADRRILFPGDSFVAGFGDPTGPGRGRARHRRVPAAGRPLTAHNLGVRGGRPGGRRHRRGRVAAAPATASSLGVGANDAVEQDGRVRVEFKRAVDNVGRMSDARVASGWTCSFVWVAARGRARAGRPRVRAGTWLRAACRRSRRPVRAHAPVLRAMPAWLGEAAAGDDTFPAAGGYAAFADLVLQAGFLDRLDK